MPSNIQKRQISDIYYNDSFYKSQKSGSHASAQIIVAYIITKFGRYIKTVVDYGCGSGAWLNVFEHYGREIKGFDFGQGVKENLFISQDKYERMDLTSDWNKEREYDLALCLEVAEHIPENHSTKLIEILVSSAPLILFSAAIPGQGGVNHINEQYPSYWIKKFIDYDYSCFDIIRPKFWYNKHIEYWYRQNCLIFKKNNIIISGLEDDKRVDIFSQAHLIDVVHPELLKEKCAQMTNMFSMIKNKFNKSL